MGAGVLIQITPQLRILVAIDAVDGRKGIALRNTVTQNSVIGPGVSVMISPWRNSATAMATASYSDSASTSTEWSKPSWSRYETRQREMPMARL